MGKIDRQINISRYSKAIPDPKHKHANFIININTDCQMVVVGGGTPPTQDFVQIKRAYISFVKIV